MDKDDLRFRIGAWVFEPALNRLTSGERTVELEPLGSRLLQTLAENPGRVFSNDELVEAVWQGRIVSDNPVYKLIANLRRSLGDDTASPNYIETIRKRGYRLVAPVEALGRESVETRDTPLSRKGLFAAGGLVFVVVTALAVAFIPRDASVDPLPGATAIAVLPFEDMSAAGDKAYLGEGLAEEIIHSLAGQEEFPVIGRTSSFAVASERQDLRDVGRLLGARYIVEGSVRQQDEKIIVTAQLIDAADGLHVWSEQFERPFDDVMSIQAEIAGLVLDSVALKVNGTPRTTSIVAVSPEIEIAAYDAYLRGRQSLALRTAVGAADAEAEFLRALELQPDMLGAMLGLVHSQWMLNFHGQKKAEESHALAQKYAERALLIAPEEAAVHTAIGLAAQLDNDWSRSEQALRTAVDLEPNNAIALSALALMLQNRNRPEEARPVYRKVLKVEPASAILAMSAAMNTEDVGEFGCADSLYRRAVMLSPDLMNAQFGLGSFLWRIHRDFAGGERHLKLSAEIDPEGPIPPAFLALMHLDREDTAAAREWVDAIPPTAVESYWQSFAKLAYAVQVGDDATALGIANDMAAYTSESNLMRVIRDHHLAAGDADAAVSAYPDWLRRDDLQWITRQNVKTAADLAYALQRAGQDGFAREMAAKVLELTRTMPRLGWRGFHFADVTATLVLDGESAAMTLLEQTPEDGRFALWWWELDHNAAFAGLRARPGFPAVRKQFASGAPDRVDDLLANSECQLN